LSASLHVAVVVGREQHKGNLHRLARAELGNGNLEIGEKLQQEGLELRIGFVDFVDEQDHGPLRADCLQKRPGLNEAVGEKGVLLRRDLIDRFRNRRRGADDIVEPVISHMRVQELLGVLPFVERLGFLEPLVALQADQIAPQAAGHGFGKLRFPHARRPLDQHGLLRGLGQKHHCGDFPRGDVTRLPKSVLRIIDVEV
jgi:hypothetical protein